MLRKLLYIFILFLGNPFFDANAQEVAEKELSLPAFFKDIKNFHPLALAADINIELADAELLAARGSFDPKLYAAWSQKQYDSKEYYDKLRSELSVATPLGIKFKAAYEQNEGQFLNPENTLGDDRLWLVGIEANLLQGLLIDESRTALRQARLSQLMAENQTDIQLNDLLYAAAEHYVEWQRIWAAMELINEGLEIANTNFENTKLTFFNGVATAIDTLESYIIVQELNVVSDQYLGQLNFIKNQLEIFLWNNETVNLDASSKPENLNDQYLYDKILISIDSLIANHPALIQYDLKAQELTITERLKRDKLKPELSVAFNPLLRSEQNRLISSYNPNDYKVGASFNMPLFFRKERGELAAIKVRQRQLQWELNDKSNELVNALEGFRFNINMLDEQSNTQIDVIENHRMLLEAEQVKFELGESSIFLLNSRQNKYIQSRMKLINLQAKLKFEMIKFLYKSNLLPSI